MSGTTYQRLVELLPDLMGSWSVVAVADLVEAHPRSVRRVVRQLLDGDLVEFANYDGTAPLYRSRITRRAA